MINATLDIADARRALLEFPDAFARQSPRMLGQIGTRLMERARADFLVKSNGGTGAGGIKWKALTPSEQRRKQRGRGVVGIGVRTGELLESLTYTIGPGSTSWGKSLEQSEVAVEFADQPKANAFNAERPLFPTMLPALWYRETGRITQSMVDQVANTLFPEG